MCTVTVWTRRNGYLLGMNRDERRTRIEANPPVCEFSAGKWVVHPVEPQGGTWISLNDHGVGFALVNWYSVQAQVQGPSRSRGDIIRAIRAFGSPEEVRAALADIPLPRINPFRLIGLFPDPMQILEWRWGLNNLAELECDWQPRQWISSGWDEAGAQRARGVDFDLHRSALDAGTIPWLRRLHSSHRDGPGPFSTCMHREDAATVSYTELEVGRGFGRLSYSAAPLCQGANLISTALEIPSLATANDSPEVSFAEPGEVIPVFP